MTFAEAVDLSSVNVTERVRGRGERVQKYAKKSLYKDLFNGTVSGIMTPHNLLDSVFHDPNANNNIVDFMTEDGKTCCCCCPTRWLTRARQASAAKPT